MQRKIWKFSSILLIRDYFVQQFWFIIMLIFSENFFFQLIKTVIYWRSTWMNANFNISFIFLSIFIFIINASIITKGRRFIAEEGKSVEMPCDVAGARKYYLNIFKKNSNFFPKDIYLKYQLKSRKMWWFGNEAIMFYLLMKTLYMMIKDLNSIVKIMLAKIYRFLS